MTNADAISIRGITCTEDANLFSEEKRLKAEVVDITHIRVYAWRLWALPHVDPDEGRHIVSNGGVIVCLNNMIRMSFAFKHAA